MIDAGKISGLLIGMMLAGSLVVAQQETSPRNEEDTAPVKLSVGLFGSYTDNRDSSEIAESTFDFGIQPRVDIKRRLSDNGAIMFYYAPTYRYRTDPSAFQNDGQLFHDLGLDLGYMVSEKTKLRLREYFNYTDDPSVQEFGFTQRSDASFILNRVEAGATVNVTRRSEFDIYGKNMIKRYSENEVAANSDEDNIGGGASVRYQVQRQLSVSLGAEVNQYSYESAANLERGFTSYMGAIGLENIFSQSFRASAKAGLEEVEYEDETLDSQSSPYVNLVVLLSAKEVTRLSLGATHSIRNSDIFPFGSQTATDLSAQLEWDAMPSYMTLALTGAYQMGDYDTDSIPSAYTGVVPVTGTRDAYLVRGEMHYTINPEGNSKTMLSLSHQYEDVSGDVGVPFTKNTTTVSVSRAF